ncbi:type II toxin-antitoxin system RelE/ParE family toxin [Candidatus Nitrospira salsa]
MSNKPQSITRSFSKPLNAVQHSYLGRSIDYIRKGYFRFEHENHVIFYQINQDGLSIMVVLHQKMDRKRYF